MAFNYVVRIVTLRLIISTKTISSFCGRKIYAFFLDNSFSQRIFSSPTGSTTPSVRMACHDSDSGFRK